MESADPDLGGRTQSGLEEIVHRNIRAMVQFQQEADRQKNVGERVSDVVSRWAGSFPFVVVHAVTVALWLLINTRVLPVMRPFDPYPFVMLAMAASVEAIFLSAFILISQNRMAQMDAKRAELDLQISLLAEHEVTRLISMVDNLSAHLGFRQGSQEIAELEHDVAPEQVLAQIDEAHSEKPA